MRTPESVDETLAWWIRWNGETQWVKLLRRFGELGGKIIDWTGAPPQSASAIPLCFSLFTPGGQKIESASRLKDIRAAVALLEAEPCTAS